MGLALVCISLLYGEPEKKNSLQFIPFISHNVCILSLNVTAINNICNLFKTYTMLRAMGPLAVRNPKTIGKKMNTFNFERKSPGSNEQ